MLSSSTEMTEELKVRVRPIGDILEFKEAVLIVRNVDARLRSIEDRLARIEARYVQMNARVNTLREEQ